MSKKIILTMLAAAMLAFVNPSEAQQPKKVPADRIPRSRIGFVRNSPHPGISPRVA